MGAREHLRELRDQHGGERAATDDRRQLPPQVRELRSPCDADVADEEIAHQIGHPDAEDRRDPDQARERLLEIELFEPLVLLLGDRLVEEVRRPRHEVHEEPHEEDPDDELRLDVGAGNGEGDERDQSDAGDAVGLEAVGRRADRVAGVVTGAVGDHAGIAGIILLDVESDLHEIGADVGDLREDAAGDAEGRGPERLADRKAEETVADDVARDEEEDDHHHDQLQRNQE